ncbi:MAG: hypothetical protein WCK75_09085 [Elusimicrobiota bacterium]
MARLFQPLMEIVVSKIIMLTKGDIADVISAYLARASAGAAAETRGRIPSRASKPLPKRVFITDWEMKRLVKPGQKSVSVPAGAIISPLSLDWLDYDGVKVVRG